MTSLLDRFSLDGKVAIVTGAGRGIGAGCARALAEAGADVVMTARTKEQLDTVADEIAAFGRRALVFPADVNDPATAASSWRPSTSSGASTSSSTTSAGRCPCRCSTRHPASFEQAFHFNVTTAFALSVGGDPPHARGRRRVVNISSAMGRLRDRGFVAYGTAKAALSHMTRLMAADWHPGSG